jgi:hypothetical protein
MFKYFFLKYIYIFLKKKKKPLKIYIKSKQTKLRGPMRDLKRLLAMYSFEVGT